jgi:hypothetical protein
MSVRAWAILFLVCWGVAKGSTLDPPERVGRLSYFTSTASLRHAGTSEFYTPIINTPLTSKDTLIIAPESRAEVTFGIAAIRMDESTELLILQLDQDITDLRIRSGTANIRLRDLPPGESFSIKVNRVSVQLIRPGTYRISALKNGGSEIRVQEGEANVNTGAASFQQLAGEVAQMEPGRELAIERSRKSDEFDQWCAARERAHSGKQSASHVARGLVGYEELDAFGTWRWDRSYGMVWQPTRVADNWAPYRFGQWIWKEPWGWTWIDATPWGFAPFHYGRWIQLGERWHWLPGPRQLPPVYAPALVKWAEDPTDRRIIGWMPLGPRERYVPAYRASPELAQRLNVFANVHRSDRPAPELPEIAANSNPPASITWADRSIFHARSPLRPARLPQSRQANSSNRSLNSQ